MNRIHRSTIVAALVAGAVAAGPAGDAIAHTKVKSTYPARGSTAKRSITRVIVTFTQQIRSGTISVTGPGGRVVSSGRGGRDPRNVRRLLVGLRGGKSAGRYTARWTILASDGHTQRGSFTFRLAR